MIHVPPIARNQLRMVQLVNDHIFFKLYEKKKDWEFVEKEQNNTQVLSWF